MKRLRLLLVNLALLVFGGVIPAQSAAPIHAKNASVATTGILAGQATLVVPAGASSVYDCFMYVPYDPFGGRVPVVVASALVPRGTPAPLLVVERTHIYYFCARVIWPAVADYERRTTFTWIATLPTQ